MPHAALGAGDTVLNKTRGPLLQELTLQSRGQSSSIAVIQSVVVF